MYLFILLILVFWILCHHCNRTDRHGRRRVYVRVSRLPSSLPTRAALINPSDLSYYEHQTRHVSTPRQRPVLAVRTDHAPLEAIYYDLPFEVEPDTQNVHDSQVQKVTQEKSGRQDKSQAVDHDAVIMAIVDHGGCDTVTEQKLAHILDQISSRNAYITNLDSTEMNVLASTWTSSPPEVRSQIVNELLDCQENEHLVCPTGVVTRIVNADVVLDPESTPVTSEIIRTELLNLAAQVQNTDPDNFKDTLNKEINTIYKESPHMDMIQKELDTWGIEY